MLLGTTGCGFFTPTATLYQYDPGNGVGATIGSVEVREAIALINEDGHAVSLMITLVNNGSLPVQVKLQYKSGGAKEDESVGVPANSVKQFGSTPEQDQIIILNPGVDAGELMELYVQYGDEQGKTLLVPVLDGTLPEYEDLVPPAVLR